MCVWDTVKDYNWRVDARTHRIRSLIDDILNKTEEEFPLPKCNKEMDCMDCEPWSFVDERDVTSTLLTATSTKTLPWTLPLAPLDRYIYIEFLTIKIHQSLFIPNLNLYPSIYVFTSPHTHHSLERNSWDLTQPWSIGLLSPWLPNPDENENEQTT
jgi:hypothetical protein